MMKIKKISYLLLCLLIALGTTAHAFNTCDSPCCTSQGGTSHESMGQDGLGSADSRDHDMEWMGIIWNGAEGDDLTDGCNPQVVYQSIPGATLGHAPQLPIQIDLVTTLVIDSPDNTAKSFHAQDTTDLSVRSGPPLYVSNATFLC